MGVATIEAVIHSQSVRQAARLAGVHHSTIQTRIETISALLGFDPFDGFGKPRLGTAYLVWRLRRSRVLDLPSPTNETRK
ncbi:helix-turn-helix domain-containing protein [Phycicoccus sp. KQZ13P-1]|uniref:helix-turn-helix domain-containing protein n=1 Tax=Phycicoccus mangrovi TaxID=2840470 RepID=UPI001C0018E3|nr:helix-turn-helix domain-containing protein [Phycicoccus mangrovi]MBT9257193.1 helix-turn-helix domain-containing protein [Phycicoccus mangrovi]